MSEVTMIGLETKSDRHNLSKQHHFDCREIKERGDKQQADDNYNEFSAETVAAIALAMEVKVHRFLLDEIVGKDPALRRQYVQGRLHLC